MDDDALQVSTTVQPNGTVTVAIRGYLDERGGEELVRAICRDMTGSKKRIEINLRAVTLFSCSGARRLLTVLEDLRNQGCDVSLVGVRQTLQKILQFAA